LLGEGWDDLADAERIARNGNDVGGGDGVGDWSNSGMDVSKVVQTGAKADTQTFSDIVISLNSFIVDVYSRSIGEDEYLGSPRERDMLRLDRV
jgi:hypothetical protein